MTRFNIRHETRYDYDRPVRFGPHRLLVRPRDSHAIRLKRRLATRGGDPLLGHLHGDLVGRAPFGVGAVQNLIQRVDHRG
jgi:hypothetical protein